MTRREVAADQNLLDAIELVLAGCPKQRAYTSDVQLALVERQVSYSDVLWALRILEHRGRAIAGPATSNKGPKFTLVATTP